MSGADRTTRPRHLLGLSDAEYLDLWGVAIHEAGHAVVGPLRASARATACWPLCRTSCMFQAVRQSI